MHGFIKREIRYQGAVVQKDQLLLIQHTHHETGRAAWVLPGGGIEPGESENARVARELLEETGLSIAVERLIVHQTLSPNDYYVSRKTYLCRVLTGDVAPGFDPEPYAAASYGITGVAWIPLAAPERWDEGVCRNHWLLPQLHAIAAGIQTNTHTTTPHDTQF